MDVWVGASIPGGVVYHNEADSSSEAQDFA